MEALLVIDLQNDFSEGGILPIKNTPQIINKINSLFPYFELIIFSLDYHPKDHISFTDIGGNWPPHCIENTEGSKLNNQLNLSFSNNQQIFYITKGTNKNIESYSVFYDQNGTSNNINNQSFTSFLKELNIDELYICGVAGEYCVKQTIIDGIKDKFFINLIKDCVGFVTEDENEINNHLNFFRNNNVWIIDSEDVKNFLDPV